MDRKTDVLEADDDAKPAAPAVALPKPASAFLKVGEQFSCPNCGCTFTLEKLPPDEFVRLKPFVCLCGERMKRQTPSPSGRGPG